MHSNLDDISQIIWDLKYRHRKSGSNIDQSIEDTWLRVAKGIAKAEKSSNKNYWQNQFYSILQDFKFLPGGRILAGAGTRLKVTLFNCFVMDIVEDSLPAIFTALKEGALTLQQGGGVGYDFSVLRPHGDLVKKTGLTASGPISFMRIWDTTCSILLSTGARRGAMMGVLRCDHPDIEAFIEAKRDARELRHFNVSVMVSDAFMQAVRNNEEWALVFPVDNLESSGAEIIYRQWGDFRGAVPCRIYKKINARSLWEKIINSAYDYAEPGVLFGDTINRLNNLYYREQINATNPCGEIPLPSYGACNLGSINLTQFVLNPFTAKASINWSALIETVTIATRFLDNVIDVSRFPLQVQHRQAQGTRRIGLGITGLADVFVMLGLVYGSPESIKITHELMRAIATTTWQSSIELAKERGSFPYFATEYLRGAYVQTLAAEIRQDIAKYGIRNSHHNTIAPAGTISLLAHNVSNGVEPIYQAQYNRHIRLPDDSQMILPVRDYALRRFHELGGKDLPQAWADTNSLSPQAHLMVQAAIQPYIDNAISKTINIPKDFPFEKVLDVYSQAYDLGLKGCTIFRPNPITGSVLSVQENAEDHIVDHCCQFEG